MRRSLLLLCLLSSVGAVSPSTQPSGVDQLITHLGDRDPDVRDQAASELKNLGTRAGAALSAASKSDDPEVATRASTILQQTRTWFVNGDSAAVRDILRTHATLSPQERTQTVQKLLGLPNDAGMPAILRLLEKETDTELRWWIVSALSTPWRYADDEGWNGRPGQDPRRHLATFRKLPTDRDDPPILCLVASAWADTDKEKAAKLYQRAIDSADLQSTLDRGEIENAFNFLYPELMSKRQYSAAAALLRKEAGRPNQPSIAGVPEPVTRLFMLHARHGPLEGYAVDRLRFMKYQLHAPILYADSMTLTRQGHWIAGETVDRFALYAGGDFEPNMRLQMAKFLFTNSNSRAAIREAGIFIDRQKDQPNQNLYLGNAYMILSQANARVTNYAAAGRALEKALEVLNATSDVQLTYVVGGEVKRGGEALKLHQADVNGYFLQDAIDRDDQAEIARRVRALQDLPMENGEFVQEVVFWLQNNGRRPEADWYFNPVEKRLMEAVAKEPTPNNKNSLAWFRAKSHRKLDEALKLANEAVEGDPTNPAYIDTLAEVHHQMGKSDEAVKLERRALALDPGAPELEYQMRRFLKGRAKE
jgi:tetratricopeptide (TPR) repeat protein